MNDSPEPVEAQPLLSGYCVFFEIRLDQTNQIALFCHVHEFGNPGKEQNFE